MPFPRQGRRASLLVTLLFAFCGAGTSSIAKDAEPAVSRKYKDYNVIFVSFDALQAAHVGSLGNARNTTPTLDALARQGISFSHAYSVASWTVPASMTWFTGVYPSEHRMTNKYAVYSLLVQKPAVLKELSPGIVTLADIMKNNGYVTGGFTGNAGVGSGFGYEQGFDVYYSEKGTFGTLDESVPRALAWLRENREKKFFLFLHGYDVHGQSNPATGFDYRFVDKEYDGKFTGSPLEQEALREEGLQNGRLTLREADVRFWRAVYDEKIQRADEKFRLFLQEFDKLGLGDKTLLFVTSDHGTELYEHRRFDHGFTLYNELLRVPLIVKLPKGGNAVGKVVTDRVSSIDVMPTILDLVDIRMPDGVQPLRGVSLVPAMNGTPARRNIISETDYRQYTYKRSLITPDGWKLIYTLETMKRELYNLNSDAGETKNLTDAEPKRAAELEEQLFAHFKSIGRNLWDQRWEIGLNPAYSSQGKKP